MFHQANLRLGDVETHTVGPVAGALSLLQIWVETVTQEMARLCVCLLIPCPIFLRHLFFLPRGSDERPLTTRSRLPGPTGPCCR